MRRPTIASSPGCNIQTPTTSVFAFEGMPWLGGCPVLGFSSIDGFPSRKLATICVVVAARHGGIEAYQQVGNVVGDSWDHRSPLLTEGMPLTAAAIRSARF